jgi:nucleotide-binding universal stress UspA family protein
MKRILVPTDFSTCADNAIDFAVQTAKIIPLQVSLVHSFELNGDLYTDFMGVNKEFNQSHLQEVNDKLAKLKSSIEKREGIIVETYVFTGTLKESIVQVANEKNIDFIIMGTAGANGIKEKLWGSKTAGIIGKSYVPVLAIPLEYTWKKPQKILLTINNFEKEPVLLNFLFEMSSLFDAEVHVAVFTNEEEDNAFTFMEHNRFLPEYKAMLTEQYQFETITVAHLFGKNFEEALQDYITLNEIDMVAMVTHKRSFTDRLFHPSITKRMSYHTKIPLLAIPVIHE